MPIGWKTITIREEVFNNLAKKHSQSKTDKKISPWTSDYLDLVMKKDELIHRYAPSLEIIGEPSDVMHIKNHKNGKIVEIRINKKGELQCTDDDPIYLHFAWSLPELAKLKHD